MLSSNYKSSNRNVTGALTIHVYEIYDSQDWLNLSDKLIISFIKNITIIS